MLGVKLTRLFAVKSMFNKYPFTVIVITMSITTFSVAYMLKIIEGPVSNSDYLIEFNDYSSLENTIWTTFVTMTTGINKY